ncbi:hypothetical protein F5883DRAFT_425727, partial [Diaporthe sp. PMI_573]
MSPTTIEDRILGSLRFRMIEDRHMSVKKAYQDTFEWILQSQKPTQPDRPENGLPKWLTDGTGIFWIRGKAGCGKSTSMKFLLGNHQLQQLLQEWAGEDELLITSYFFWAAGSSLQKNQEGLLRSLLYSILSRRKDLIPNLFPFRYTASMNKHKIESEKEQIKLTALCETEFTLPELYDVFLRLAHTLTKGLKIVLIVDGLDEYKGDQADLVDFFKDLTSGSTVKAIVSSRPEPLFMNALQACQSLRMDLLMKDDMELYVTSKLELHRHMRRFLSTNAGCLQDISTTVAKQSSGVFLWTALVVRLLEEMLDTGCFLRELSEAIYAYPVEISALFRHMLLRAKEGHKTERFRI